MAPKRNVKNISLVNNNYNNLKLTDVLCPICRSILIEPVTLPCNHGFCSVCFDGTVANTNLVCPLCRIRIGSWLRTTKKYNKLVNSVLWEAIQKKFPEEIKNKYNGVEEYPEEDVPRKITAAGEIGREYEEQKVRELQELQKQRNVEAKASEELIRKLKEEEEQEEALRSENIKLSEQVAKKLAKEYCFDPGPSSSKSNVTIKSKKEGPIDKLLKNMGEKKLTVTLQSVPKNVTPKEYTCKILCQDRSEENKNSVVDKAALINLKMKDKLKKMISEGEASDSNDSIASECRYFKPIEQRCVPLSRKVPIIKVPAIITTANTVIIGPPKGETNFKHANNYSAFAVVNIVALPISIPKTETTIKGTISGSACDMDVTEIEPIEHCEITESPKRHNRNKSRTAELFFATPNSSRYETRNKYNQKSPVRNNERTPEKKKILPQKLVFTPSKRKRLRGSPVVSETVSRKRSKIANGNLVVSPPFHGFDNKNLNAIKVKHNGTIPSKSNFKINNNTNVKISDNDIKEDLKKLQEEEDFKLAKQLHEELNNKYRYSTRNSINVQVKNITKPSARQVTLKEIMSQKTNKIP